MENCIYRYELLGEFIAPIRGGIPEDCGKLIEKGTKDVNDLNYKIVVAEVESLLDQGKVKDAAEVVENYKVTKIDPYNNPLNVFKRDKQNGGAPYMGAHWLFGAIRDAAKFVFPKDFHGPGCKKGAPSRDHFRKFVDVTPYHIFFHQPKYEKNNKNVVKEVDGIDDQQPSGKIKGFARYEKIESPLQFRAEVLVSPRGLFFDLLEDPDNMLEIIHQARNHRLGSCRSAGYGMWNVIELAFKTGS